MVSKMDDSGFQIASPAFANNQAIPAKYTCKGENINPLLRISGVPAGARSLALIMHDPDAPNGNWVHWTLWNVSPTATEIVENSVPQGAREGLTSFGKPSYGGPCPPVGNHRYYFDLYALETEIDLPATSTDQELKKAFKGKTIALAQLMGTFSAQG